MTTADHRSHRGSSPGGTGASAPTSTTPLDVALVPEVPGSAVPAAALAPVAPDSAPALLRSLLTRDGPYRRRWRREVRRVSARDPHQSAVAMVLAQHLWDTGEVSEDDRDLPRRLKDVVARALSGRGISHQTLGWFVAAFALSEDDELALWQQFEADLRADASTPTPVRGPADQDRAREATPVSAQPHHVATPTYRTRSLIEQFQIGQDRGRARHSLVHIVQARQQLDRISYRFDTAAVTVEVSRGGRATALRPGAGGVHAVEVLFPAALAAGQSAVVQLTATYAPDGRPLTAFRRSLRATAGGVSLELCFDPAALPGGIRWVEWECSGPGTFHTEDIPHGPEGVVHRFLTPDRDCVVGFEWDW